MFVSWESRVHCPTRGLRRGTYAHLIANLSRVQSQQESVAYGQKLVSSCIIWYDKKTHFKHRTKKIVFEGFWPYGRQNFNPL